MSTRPITPAFFDFLRELKSNNEKAWFQANRRRYEAEVRDPILDLIGAFAGPLAEISPHFQADPRPNGGSLFRIHRDTRFSKDKTPYKTNVGAHFRHTAAKDAHAPGFYLHLEPGRCFAACGIWRPGGEALAGIRNAIAVRPEEWRRITTAPEFLGAFHLRGESLKRPPRGFDPGHPMIEDLKRKDFMAATNFPDSDACKPDFLGDLAATMRKGGRFVGFLSGAVGVPF